MFLSTRKSITVWFGDPKDMGMQKSGAGRNFENAVGEVGDNAQHAPHLERHGRARLTALQSQRAMYMAYLNRYTDAYVYVCVYVVCSMCMHLHGCGHVKQTCKLCMYR